MPDEYEEYVKAKDGNSIHTTLDVFVQAALDEQLQTAYTESGGQNRAAGIVMNVNTGAILAMSTYPNFDLNDPWSPDERSEATLRESGYAEDSEEYGARDLLENGAQKGDAVVGISAAGSAPYVCGALKKALELGCATLAVTSNPEAPILELCEVGICTRTGAEVITGSTRMKAGTAQKLVLNALSTCAMVKTGKVYENLMINLRPSNVKLRARMIGIVKELTGLAENEAEALLEANGWDIRSSVSSVREL